MVGSDLEGKIHFLILAGSETDPERVLGKRLTFMKNHGVDYFEGLNKGIDILVDGKPMLQYMIDIYSASKYSAGVTVAGPKGVLEKNGIHGCEIIDTNVGILKNLGAGVDFIEEKFGDVVIGVSTNDLPALTTEKINEYIQGNAHIIRSISLMLQFMNKKSLRISDNSYNKPGYKFVHDGEEIELLIGHLNFGRSKHVDREMFSKVGQILYDVRGLNIWKKVALGLRDAFKEGIIFKNSTFEALKKYKKTPVGLAGAVTSLFLNKPYRVLNSAVIGVAKDRAFGVDVDTREELDSFRKDDGIDIRLSDSAEKKFGEISQIQSLYKSCVDIGCKKFHMQNAKGKTKKYSARKMRRELALLEASIILDNYDKLSMLHGQMDIHGYHAEILNDAFSKQFDVNKNKVKEIYDDVFNYISNIHSPQELSKWQSEGNFFQNLFKLRFDGPIPNTGVAKLKSVDKCNYGTENPLERSDLILKKYLSK